MLLPLSMKRMRLSQNFQCNPTRSELGSCTCESKCWQRTSVPSPREEPHEPFSHLFWLDCRRAPKATKRQSLCEASPSNHLPSENTFRRLLLHLINTRKMYRFEDRLAYCYQTLM